MKNSRMIFAAVAVALSLGTVSMEAKSPMSSFNDKVKDFKKAYKDGELTRRQKVAAAVAITAAAMAVIAGSYKAGSVAKSRGYVRTGAILKTPGRGILDAGTFAAKTRTGQAIGKVAAETGESVKDLGSKAYQAMPGRPSWTRRAQ